MKELYAFVGIGTVVGMRRFESEGDYYLNVYIYFLILFHRVLFVLVR